MVNGGHFLRGRNGLQCARPRKQTEQRTRYIPKVGGREPEQQNMSEYAYTCEIGREQGNNQTEMNQAEPTSELCDEWTD